MTTALTDAGVGLLPIDIQAGATITYSWLTDVMKAISGLEQRVALRSHPHQKYDFPILLGDDKGRAMLAMLSRHAHTAALFRVSLPHESMLVKSSTSGTIETYGLTFCDWNVAGQRILVLKGDGTTGETVAASSAGATLTVDNNLTAAAVDGSTVMPTMPVYLEPSQQIGRYAKNLDTIDLVAHAAISALGFGTMGSGATVTEYDGMPVWTWGIEVDSIVSQPLESGTTLINNGLKVGALATMAASDWIRDLKVTSTRRSDWQWLKAFLSTVRGRLRAFLLPTGRPDLVPIGDASSGVLTIDSTDANYVTDWWPSLAHRRIRIVLTTGVAHMRTISSASGTTPTQSLVLSSPLAGAIDHVEFLETARLEKDEVAVRWDSPVFSSQFQARVVQR